MAYWLMKRQEGRSFYECDTEDDVENLPIQGELPGAKCVCDDNGKVYALSGDTNTWGVFGE